MFVPVSDPPASTPTGLAHVATVSFLAARAAPSMQFWIALAGGIALARTAALQGRADRLRRERGGDAADDGRDGPRARERAAHPGADRADARRAAPPRHARPAADRRLLRDPADPLRGADRRARVDRARRGRRLRGQLRHAHRLAGDPPRGPARRADRHRRAQRRARDLLQRHPGARVPLGARLVAGRAARRGGARRGSGARTAARRASTRARSRSRPRSRSRCC